MLAKATQLGGKNQGSRENWCVQRHRRCPDASPAPLLPGPGSPHTASRIQSCSAHKRRTFGCASVRGSVGLNPTARRPSNDSIPGPGKSKGVFCVLFHQPWELTCLTSKPYQICFGREAVASLSSMPRETGRPSPCSLWGWGGPWDEGSTSLG